MSEWSGEIALIRTANCRERLKHASNIMNVSINCYIAKVTYQNREATLHPFDVLIISDASLTFLSRDAEGLSQLSAIWSEDSSTWSPEIKSDAGEF